METNISERLYRRSLLLSVAWVVTLLVSALPTILLNEIGPGAPDWLFWASVSLVAALLLLAFFWNLIKPLRAYFIAILVSFLAEWLLPGYLGKTALWKSWLNSAVFTSSMLGMQILRLGVALVMVAAMLLVKKRRSEIFLVKGDLSAPAEPIPLVMTRQKSWSKLGLYLALFISLGTIAFLLIASRPSFGVLSRVVPLLPAVLLFAAMNSFSEEMSYKASFLSALHDVIGKDQSLLLTAAFFGIGHYYGVPYGIVGVLMAGVLGWLLGKSMLETRGFTWAWSIHFCQDVLIFSFMAIGSIMAGGG